jgi:hypothetical protein
LSTFSTGPLSTKLLGKPTRSVTITSSFLQLEPFLSG